MLTSRPSIVVAKLFSSAGTGFMYALRRPRAAPKLELRKYDPIGRKAQLRTRY